MRPLIAFLGGLASRPRGLLLPRSSPLLLSSSAFYRPEALLSSAPPEYSHFCVSMSSRGGRTRRSNNRPNRNRPNRRSSGGGGRGGGGGGGRRRRRSRTPPPPIPPPGQPGRECFRELILIGTDVFVVKKEDQRTGKETKGSVSRLLTNSAYHPRGIKVMLTSGVVGRVTRFVSENTPKNDVQVAVEPNNNTSINASSFVIDDEALAKLVGEMDFDAELAREALEMYDNNMEQALNHLLQ